MKTETQHKKSYLAPTWRVVSFKTERGAFSSGTPKSVTQTFGNGGEFGDLGDVSSGAQTQYFGSGSTFGDDAF